MSVLNSREIAFIICVNDEETFEECQYYLNRLAVPSDLRKDIIAVRDAPSMAAGYNAAMNSSDAKYKVYMHQDVFILNPNFIRDILKVFDTDSKIGILGCVGTTNLGKEAMAVTSWNAGKIIHHCGQRCLEFDEIKEHFVTVAALDGLLLATQYDIPWREDIMDGWDFYDVSQCMEFARKGYLAVVPRQENVWCYHDNRSSDLSNYHFYRKRFIKEYQSDGEFELSYTGKGDLEYEEIKGQMEKIIERLFLAEDRERIYEIFQNIAMRKYIHVIEYGVIADIDELESRNNMEKRMWEPGMDIAALFRKVRRLKYRLIRIEYQAADIELVMDQIIQEYSVYAAAVIFNQYVVHKEYVCDAVKQFFEQKGLFREAEVWKSMCGQ